MEPISIILGVFIAGLGMAAAQQKEEQYKKKTVKAEQEVIKRKQQEQPQQLNSSNIKCPHCKQNIKLIY